MQIGSVVAMVVTGEHFFRCMYPCFIQTNFCDYQKECSTCMIVRFFHRENEVVEVVPCLAALGVMFCYRLHGL